MAKILAFAGSNSSTSINYQLIKYTSSLIENHDVRTMNMANYPFPMFSVDLEKNEGYSNSLVEFKNDIQKSDALIISVNEHNSMLSAYFKNVLDWLSRLERKFLLDKKLFLMSTSNGKRGGLSALEFARDVLLPRFGAEIVSTFTLPGFEDNYDIEKGISAEDLNAEHRKCLHDFLKTL